MQKPRIFDFTSRLPGPLAGYLFAQKGFEVYKLETHSYPDPFDDDQMQKLDPIFKVWYQQMNANKKVIRADSSKLSQHLSELITDKNIFLCSSITKLKVMLGPLPTHSQVVWVEVAAGVGDDRYMHDLNAIAQTDIFQLHLAQTDSPPFVPIAGVCFAQDIVNSALIATFELSEQQRSVETTVYMSQSIKSLFSPLWSDGLDSKALYLHTGRFPCYQIYNAKDCKVAVAAVEEKFWSKFISAFDLKLSIEDRLSSNPEIVRMVSNKIQQYQRQDLQKLPLGQMCLTLI